VFTGVSQRFVGEALGLKLRRLRIQRMCQCSKNASADLVSALVWWGIVLFLTPARHTQYL
jgi:hypothetical protein